MSAENIDLVRAATEAMERGDAEGAVPTWIATRL
jgi:hypothetical protein